MGEASQLHKLGRAVGTASKSYAEDLRRYNRIIRECLIKVADTKKKNRIRMLGLHLRILFHQRSLYKLLSHKRLIYGMPIPRGLL